MYMYTPLTRSRHFNPEVPETVRLFPNKPIADRLGLGGRRGQAARLGLFEMLSRLPVLAPIGWRIETEDAMDTHPQNTQTAAHKTTPSKPAANKSAEDLFQDVITLLCLSRK